MRNETRNTFYTEQVKELNSIIARLERQVAAIERAIEALREVAPATPAKKQRGRPKGGKRANRKRSMSVEGRQRQIEALRRYWAAKKADGKMTSRKRAAKRAG